MVYVLGLLPRTVHLDSHNALHTRKTAIIIICTGRTGPDSVENGWAVSTGQEWAGPGQAAQDRSGQGREVPGSAGHGRTDRAGP